LTCFDKCAWDGEGVWIFSGLILRGGDPGREFGEGIRGGNPGREEAYGEAYKIGASHG
jgi:hypothetical protein